MTADRDPGSRTALDGAGVLVTGGQGFVGGWLVERLLEAGARVVVPERAPRELSHFRAAGLGDRCRTAPLDLGDAEELLGTLDAHEVELIFHLAGRTHPTGSLPASALVETNLVISATVLEACRLADERGAPIRAVLASSSLAYGRPGAVPVDESAALRPLRPYAASKASIDMIARSYATTFGLRVAVTRLANVYGGGDPNAARLIPGAAAAIAAGERPVIRSDGTPEREYLFVRDAAEAYLAVAESLRDPTRAGRAWNVGTGRPVSVLELVRRLIAVSGRDLEPYVREAPPAGGEVDRLCLDSGAIREELGWAPAWDLDRGLDETWRWYEGQLAGGPEDGQRVAAEATD